MGDSMNIAETIRQYQDENNISRAEMARRVGVPVTTLQSWESEEIQPRWDNFLKLINVTGHQLPSDTGAQSTTHGRQCQRVSNGAPVSEAA